MGTTGDETDSACVEASKTPPQEAARSHQGSLRSKLVLSLAAIFVMFLLIDDVVRRRVIAPEFISLEQAGAIRDARRVHAAIQSETEHLCEVTDLWAAQIHTDRGTGRPPRISLVPQPPDQVHGALRTSECVVLRETDGRWHWLRADDVMSATNRVLAEKHFDGLLASRTDPSGDTSLHSNCCGQTTIGDSMLLLYSIRQLENDRATAAAPDPRYLIVLRHFDEPMRSSLCEQTQVSFSLEPSQSHDRSKESSLRPREPSSAPPVVRLPLSGPSGDPAVDICIEVPQEITARSLRISKLARNSFMIGSVAALLILLVTLQRIVIGPLASIREHSNRIAEQGFSTEPMLMQRNDEIGQLANAFDQMVQKLRHAQLQLKQASEAAGRSQVASTVIHNVGNVLTNVNSLVDTVNASVEGLRIGPLEKLADRLRRDRQNDLLLAATPDYLEGLAGSLKSDQQSIQQLISKLHDNVRHIHDVIRDQQQHADPNIKPSSIPVQEIVHEAIAFCQATLEREQVSVETDGLRSVAILSDRSLLLQAMINIINNAGHAMRDNNDRPRVLRIEAKHHGSMVQVTFCDNGCGMADETLQRVFDAHFTTRESGTGLGLHFCALTLKRLGGSIRALSGGPGRGATFILEIPRLERTALAPSSLASSATTYSSPITT
jgi:signal transduction histidine kinase